MKFRKLFVIALIWCFSQSPHFAVAIPWQARTFELDSQNWTLARFFAELGRVQGVSVQVDPAVQGQISGDFKNTDPDLLLDQVCRAFSLSWLYDGSALFIYPVTAVKTEVRTMGSVVVGQTLALFNVTGIQGERADIKIVDAQQGLAAVTGPPRYFELVNSFATQFDRRAAEPVVQVFPLKYAWAYDLKFSFRDDKVTIPGVATVLQNIVQNGNGGSKLNMESSNPKSTTVPKLRGHGLAASSQEQISASQSATPAPKNGEGNAESSSENNNSQLNSNQFPQIYPDVRLNAVVVRDTRDNVARIGDLIQSLDRPVSLIEIRAAIIDVSEDHAKDLGTDWSLAVTPGESINQTAGALSVPDLISGAAGYNPSVLLVKNGIALLAQIKALQEKDKAKILAQPAILTLDNMEATLRDDQTFYVRVAGAYNVDLFNVTAGTTLQVTPHVVVEGGLRTIKLVINIIDGNVTTQTVDSIPEVRETNINTQATVRENQSLLLGGYSRDQNSDTVRKVPYLSRIPVLGYLFKRELSNRNRLRRLFLITPRIINLSYEHSPDVSQLMEESEPSKAPTPPPDSKRVIRKRGNR